MFKRRKNESDVPSIEITPALINLIAVASVELESRNDRAIERWNIGGAGGWSADLAAGTMSLTFPDRVLTAPVQLIGSFSPTTSTWLWSWGNAAMPDHITRDARATRELGEREGISALTTPKLLLPEQSLAEDLAAVTVEHTGATGMYRGPGAAIAYLAFGDFTESEVPGT
jgi:hypothetical protein